VADVGMTRKQFDSVAPLFRRLREKMLEENKMICEITFGYDELFSMAIGGRAVMSGEAACPKLKVDYFRARSGEDREVVKGRRGEYEAVAVLNFIYEKLVDALRTPGEGGGVGQEQDGGGGKR